MAREEMVLQFAANDAERSICFMDPPICTDVRRYERFTRDMHRLQWFAQRHGFDQTAERWMGVFEQEEYVSALRYLEKFGWSRNIPGPVA